MNSMHTSSVVEMYTVEFYGNDLFVAEHNGEPVAPMKPIVEGMGMDWKSQHRKLSDNKKRWGVVIMTIPTAGERQKTVCMPIRKLPAFFASISVNKVRRELRPMIELFQAECDDVLWRHWSQKKGIRQIAEAPQQAALPAPANPYAEIDAKLAAMEDARNAFERATAEVWTIAQREAHKIDAKGQLPKRYRSGSDKHEVVYALKQVMPDLYESQIHTMRAINWHTKAVCRAVKAYTD